MGCSACAGIREANCTETPQEPFSDYQGSLSCLRSQAGDIAFLESHTAQRLLAAARLQPSEVAMVCRSGEVIDFTMDEEILKKCSFGAVPHSVLMTAYNRTGSWRWNVTKALLHAQRVHDISPMAEFTCNNGASYLKTILAPTACECIPCEEVSTQASWNEDNFWKTDARMFVPRQGEGIKNQWGNEAFWQRNVLNPNFDLEDAVVTLRDLQQIDQRTAGTKKETLCEKPWMGEDWQTEWFAQAKKYPVCEQKGKMKAVKKIQMIVGQMERGRSQ